MSELSFKQKETFSSMSEEELIAAQRFCEDYKKFLDASKIEYYGVKNAVAEAEKAVHDTATRSNTVGAHLIIGKVFGGRQDISRPERSCRDFCNDRQSTF